ncbi:hypothetical protein TYRP_013360 [Tyrophagus putrescentiae]|nr:hypothetical protein TYRP_013360 [Tyrophagus putrescentiae]
MTHHRRTLASSELQCGHYHSAELDDDIDQCGCAVVVVSSGSSKWFLDGTTSINNEWTTID